MIQRKLSSEEELTRAEFGAEEMVGPVLGVRAFMFDAPGRPGLSGMWGVPWSSGVNVATCYYGSKFKYRPRGVDEEHSSPDIDCSCGFYAYSRVPDYQVDHAPVLAVIVGYGGSILGGSLGFRCERARLVAVAPNHRAPEESRLAFTDSSERFSEHYGAPILENLDALLAEFSAPGDD